MHSRPDVLTPDPKRSIKATTLISRGLVKHSMPNMHIAGKSADTLGERQKEHTDTSLHFGQEPGKSTVIMRVYHSRGGMGREYLDCISASIGTSASQHHQHHHHIERLMIVAFSVGGCMVGFVSSSFPIFHAFLSRVARLSQHIIASDYGFIFMCVIYSPVAPVGGGSSMIAFSGGFSPFSLFLYGPFSSRDSYFPGLEASCLCF